MNSLKYLHSVLLFFILSVTTFFLNQTLYSSTHEHLFYIYSSKDIPYATIKDIPLISLDEKLVLLDSFPQLTISDRERIKSVFYRNKNTFTYNDLITEIRAFTGQRQEEVHQDIFDMPSSFFNKNSYISSDKIRKNLFLYLLENGQEEQALNIYKNFLKRVPASERPRVIFGVPNELFYKEFDTGVKKRIINGPRFLKNLKALALQYDSQFDFIYSFVRNQVENMGEDVFQQEFLKLKESMSDGVASGIDIAGSIDEEDEKTTNCENNRNIPSGMTVKECLSRLASRLELLFKTVGENQGTLRMHMFEGASKGFFYDFFFKTFERYALEGAKTIEAAKKIPREIFIGHSKHIHSESVDRLTLLKTQLKKTMNLHKLKFTMASEMNVTSNVALSKDSHLQSTVEVVLKDLAKTATLLYEKEIPVIVGTDGRGKFGEDRGSIANQIKFLTPFLSSAIVEQLKKDSLGPEQEKLKFLFCQPTSLSSPGIATTCPIPLSPLTDTSSDSIPIITAPLFNCDKL